MVAVVRQVVVGVLVERQAAARASDQGAQGHPRQEPRLAIQSVVPRPAAMMTLLPKGRWPGGSLRRK